MIDMSGLRAGQLIRFCKEMKRGDIVTVPSQRGERLSIGVINDDSPYEEALTYDGKTYKDFSKRRKVKWIRGVDGFTINPNLVKLFLNPQAITDATSYSHWIDSLLYQFFQKGGEFHYVLQIKTKDHIRAHVLFGACSELFTLASEFAEQEKLDADFEGIDTRINLNSPGAIEFWQIGVSAVALLAVMVVGINGGGFEFNLPKGYGKITLKTTGLIANLPQLIASLNNFLNDRSRRRMVEELRKKFSAIKIETPEQVIELLEQSLSNQKPPPISSKPKLLKPPKTEGT